MEFTMKDYESVALHTATGEAVNVQHKKPFDIADVDNNAMKLEVNTNLLKTKSGYCDAFYFSQCIGFMR